MARSYERNLNVENFTGTVVIQIGILAILPAPDAYINISSGIFLSSHTPWDSIDLQTNAAKRMLRLLNDDAKINFYEPSCSINTVWHFKWWHISIVWDSLQEGIHWTTQQKGLCFLLGAFHFLWPRWTGDGAEMRGEYVSNSKETSRIM